MHTNEWNKSITASTAMVLLLVLLLTLATAPQSLAKESPGDDRHGPDNFHFAVIGDNSGGSRDGVLAAGVDALNLLRPEFVLGVGDLIEGYTDDEAELKRQWQTMDAVIGRLAMPFFYVPGNHDVNFAPSEQLWFNRADAERSYTHFTYEDVLFLLISTEDPPKQEVSEELEEKYALLKQGKISGEEGLAVIAELEAWAGAINISDAQVDYFKKVLADNPDVRWTFLFMHSPAWMQEDPGNFAQIESLLADRPYTVFAGHTHAYDYTVRNGRDYITMATTGGLSPAGGSTGNMDHVAWVTMTSDEPVIGNLILNGILGKQGATPALQDFLLYRPR